MKTRSITLALAFFTMAGGAHAQGHGPGGHAHATAHPPPASPYAGETGREIRALSPEEQRAWLEGQGSGLARAAELNGLPGPMHVLELARPLGLSADQVRGSQELMHRHKAAVRALGERLVALERELDRLFAGPRPVNGAEASRLAEAIGTTAGLVRASHLQTHIDQAALLGPEQIALYHRLRGD